MDELKIRPEIPWWQQVDWSGAVAFVLALGVSLSMTTALIGALILAIMYGRPISDVGATLLSTIFGAAIGALATYLGQSRQRQLDEEKK